MATFSVVMRSLSKGKYHSLKQCISQTNDILRCLEMKRLDATSFQLYNNIHKQYSLQKRFHSQSSSHPPVPASSSLSSSFRFPHCTVQIPKYLSNQATLISLQCQRTHRRYYSSLNDKSTTSSSNESQNKKDELEPSNDSGESKKEKKESRWTGKNSWRLGLMFLGGTFIAWGIALVNIWGAPGVDPDGNEIVDEFSVMPAALAYLRRTWKEMNVVKKTIQDPSREQLLPDPLKYPYMQPPYTLVIEMTDVLIHPEWTYNTGWRFKKRPGIDYFLQHVGPPLYEVVIYSKESGMTADPLVNHLDPQGYIMYRLYRDATRYMEGKHVKDLSCLNREMSKVIMLDCSKDAVSLQPRNSLVMDKWNGDDADRKLIDLAHFLKTIAASGVEDVRAVLDYYNQFDDPIEAFKDNQRKLQEEEEATQKKGKEESLQKKGWLSGFGKKR